tara:strand:+ start:380 stop:1084 length:705 start_codon:yes stop_codon:yes gene_type:complete
MLHLDRWHQHQLYITDQCDYDCLGCQRKPAVSKAGIKQVLDLARPKDWLNVYGGNPWQHPQCMAMLTLANQRRLRVRVWGPPTWPSASTWSHLVHEVVVWCPSPTKAGFLDAAGRPWYDAWHAAVMACPVPVTMSLNVRPITMEWLPDWYDTVVAARAQGMVLYAPKEFGSEERRYIQRFRRVPGMRVVPLRHAPTTHCLGVPNIIGSWGFEWHDWCYAVRASLRRVPLVKHVV